MSTIDRYRKKGGFTQLLQLIETSSKGKQDKFLQMIGEESPAWAAAIKEKMLTIDRILSWRDQTIEEVLSQVNELTLGTAIVGLGSNAKDKIFKLLSHAQQRRVTVIIDEKQESTPAEHAAAQTKIIQEVREMLKDKRLRTDLFDAKLDIPQDIENMLAKGVFSKDEAPAQDVTLAAPHLAAVPTPAPTASSPLEHPNNQHAEDLANFQNRVHFLTQENNNLRLKVRQLEGKLDQIRKIA